MTPLYRFLNLHFPPYIVGLLMVFCYCAAIVSIIIFIGSGGADLTYIDVTDLAG